MVKTNAEAEAKNASSPKRKTGQRKRHNTGVWPCKINGCNKEFAREADLKRHQRTTKVHSQPGFMCPQCEATFTRTDALKRHQKSRHYIADEDEIIVHTVMIEPEEPLARPPSTGSKSRSPSPSQPTQDVEMELDPAPGISPHYRNLASSIPPSAANQFYRFAIPTSSTRSSSDPNTPPVVAQPTYNRRYYRTNDTAAPDTSSSPPNGTTASPVETRTGPRIIIEAPYAGPQPRLISRPLAPGVTTENAEKEESPPPS